MVPTVLLMGHNEQFNVSDQPSLVKLVVSFSVFVVSLFSILNIYGEEKAVGQILSLAFTPTSQKNTKSMQVCLCVCVLQISSEGEIRPRTATPCSSMTT